MPRTHHVMIAASAALALAALAADAQGSRRSGTSSQQSGSTTAVETAPAAPAPAPSEPAPAPSEPSTTAPGFGAQTTESGAEDSAAEAPVPVAPEAGDPAATADAQAEDTFTPDEGDQAAAKLPAPVAASQDIEFGDDSSEYANDGECDDRRFRGAVMATSLTLEHSGHDASDCRNGLSQGLLTLWDYNQAMATTFCGSVDFGDDSSEYAEDNQCDDPRFEGIGMASVLRPDDVRVDATDCRRLCTLGMIGLRDY